MFLKTVLRSFTDFYRDGGLMLAASISYFSIMAIIPFCLLLITIFGYILGHDQELLGFFSERFMNFFPRAAYEITEEIQKLIAYKGLGPFTSVVYAALSYNLFSSLETAVNVVFKTKAGRTFIISFLLSLLIITLISVFIIVSFGATYVISMLEALRRFFPALRMGRVTGFLIGYAVPLLLLFLTITVLYVLLPRKKIKRASVLTGALFSAVFLEAAKRLFTIYVLKVAKFGAVYGPLSALVIFLLWIYYSSCVFLIGAELVRNLDAGTEGRK